MGFLANMGTKSFKRAGLLSAALTALVLSAGPATGNDLPGHPIVDDVSSFIAQYDATGTDYRANFGDLDLLVLRERYHAGPNDLSQYNNTLLNQVSLNRPNLVANTDCYQSILIRFFDGAAGTVFRQSQGKITINDGPGTDVRIIGVISDVEPQPDPYQSPFLVASDSHFQNTGIPGVSTGMDEVLQAAVYRWLEKAGAPKDALNFLPGGKELEFTLSTSSGADDFRVIIDYGTGCTPTTFPVGVSFDVELYDSLTLTKGIKVGTTEYGEALAVRNIPLTGTGAATYWESPIRLPDVNYSGMVRSRDLNPAYGGDDDDTAIFWMAADPSLADGTAAEDAYIYLLDGDVDVNPSSGIDDFGIGPLPHGDSFFEYSLYGGPGAIQNDDLYDGGNVPDRTSAADPTPNLIGTDDFEGTLIDINPDAGRETLNTRDDNGTADWQLKDRDWTIIGIDMDANPGHLVTAAGDPRLFALFGKEVYLYKFVMDGRDVSGQVAVGQAQDFNRFQFDVSTSPAVGGVAMPNVGDCFGTTVSNCVIPFAYELTFAGRPSSQIPVYTQTFLWVPESTGTLHELDVQTLDMDQETIGTADVPNASISILPPNTTMLSTPFGDSTTFESGDQFYGGSYYWTGVNQGQRPTSILGKFPMSGKDGNTCTTNTSDPVCYDTSVTPGWEKGLWEAIIDPVELVNPFGLRAFFNNDPLALANDPLVMIPVPASPDSDMDGVSDVVDNCPYVPNGPDLAVTPGDNQWDTDGDGVGDACDNCNLPNPNQTDTNNNGIGDACEGAGDQDGDGVLDGNDNCPTIPNANQANNDAHQPPPSIWCDSYPTGCDAPADTDGDVCDPDDDNDGVPDLSDNCPFTINGAAQAAVPGVGDQTDSDNNGVGDACQADDDSDGILDGVDNCPTVPNVDQADNDLDGLGDACDLDDDNDNVNDVDDNCPFTPNEDQANNDLADEIANALPILGDVCDPDDDNDGVLDTVDNCQFVANPGQADINLNGIGDACEPDADGDGVPDDWDNCPNDPNGPLSGPNDQLDTDMDGFGDVCDVCPYTDENDLSDHDGVCGPPDADTGVSMPACCVGDLCDPGLDPTDPNAVCYDNCISVANGTAGSIYAGDIQRDADADGMGDACDLCPGAYNPPQGAFGLPDPYACETDDSDGDGVNDPYDNCILVPNPGQEDSDLDAVGDACDLCPTTSDPHQGDHDLDGIGDACDSCIDDIDDFPACDFDNDGVGDATDSCPLNFNSGSDTDGDGVDDVCDNCIGTPNPNQYDQDGDTVGDACDNCVTAANPDQLNSDVTADAPGDSWGDICDNCDLRANENQADANSDGVGDVCQGDDDDGDGHPNDRDNCPNINNPWQHDWDGDNIGDYCDRCIVVPNPSGQTFGNAAQDWDGDGVPDACDADIDGDGQADFEYDQDGNLILNDDDVDNDHVPNWADPDDHDHDHDYRNSRSGDRADHNKGNHQDQLDNIPDGVDNNFNGIVDENATP